ncbi:MAG: hypothetical protein WBD34_11130 [Burkholderiaceae bacterium]
MKLNHRRSACNSLLPFSYSFLTAIVLGFALTACGGGESSMRDTNAGNTPPATVDAGTNVSGLPANAMRLQLSATTLADSDANIKAAGDNLINLNGSWRNWSGEDSGIAYDAATNALQIPGGGSDLVIGVQRFGTPLTAGASYKLNVEASDAQAAAILFLFDSSGAIVPVPGSEGLSIATSAAAVTFVAPANIAGFYLQVQNRYQAGSSVQLAAELIEDPGATTVGDSLIDLSGPWTDWSGNPTAVSGTTESVTLPAPSAGMGNTIGVRRFATSLVEGTRYEFAVQPSSHALTAALLFLFDAEGQLIPFVDSAGLSTFNWVSATKGSPRRFIAPDSVASFAVQVQGPYQSMSEASITPLLLIYDAESVSCERDGLHRIVSNTGNELDDHSRSPSISPDGRYIAFFSRASNVLTGLSTAIEPGALRDNNLVLYDRLNDESRVIAWSVRDNRRYSQKAAFSGDSKFIAFAAESYPGLSPDDITGTQAASNIYLYDIAAASLERLTNSQVNSNYWDHVGLPSLSYDGRHVAYLSTDPHPLRSGDFRSSNALFVLDRVTNEIDLISDGVSNLVSGNEGASLSADGRYVAFSSSLNTLIEGEVDGLGPQVFLFDRESRSISRVSGIEASRNYEGPVFVDNDRSIAYIGDAEQLFSGRRTYLFSRSTGETEILPGSALLRTAISLDGNVVANAGEIYDRTTGAIVRIPDLLPTSRNSAVLSSDGNLFAYRSILPNLVANDLNEVGDVFVQRRECAN